MKWKTLIRCLSVSLGALVATPHPIVTAETFVLPKELPKVNDISKPYEVSKNGRKRALTIEPYLQRHLDEYIANNFSPVAAVIVVDVATGRVLALSQGMSPDKWGSDKHTGLHELFPAASIFKTVATTAALEVLDLDADQLTGIRGGCGDVHRSGVWLRDQKPSRNFRMSLRRAYGLSCNGYFAKIAVNDLGLGTLMHYAELYGWNRSISADFAVPISPLKAPDSRTASALTVGKFSAGFGYVGLNAVHAAWMMLAIARDGEAIPLKIVAEAGSEDGVKRYPQIIKKSTASRLRDLMDYTVKRGTAQFAFRSRKFWRIRRQAGGKTGTLTGDNPKGMTTWFAGMMPLEKPEIVVAGVVVLEDLWHIKGPNLAAEAMYAYKRMNQKKKSLFQSDLAANDSSKEKTP